LFHEHSISIQVFFEIPQFEFIPILRMLHYPSPVGNGDDEGLGDLIVLEGEDTGDLFPNTI
jgi:hypothetical protein